MNTSLRLLGFLLSIFVACAAHAGAQQPANKPTQTADLTSMNIEDLMNVQVISVSKKEQGILKTGGAIYVITQEDIRRSGATNIPDLLRMVPGVDVAQIDANSWAISIRGFNNRLANKVLVLIDGRTVYTPVTSGVYWDQQDVPLADIDRIEVIRGPGGTVWGANAVNGVINIITKSADVTKGGLLSAGGGAQNRAQGLAQYGGEIGSKGTYRIFENYATTGSLTPSNAFVAVDGWNMLHEGFRSDWKLSSRDTATVQGDLINTGGGQTLSLLFSKALPLQLTFNDGVSTSSGNVLGRWKHTFSNGSETSLQIYYDRYQRREMGSTNTLNTLDIDFSHHVTLGSRHDIVWGAGYRVTGDDLPPTYDKAIIPQSRTNSLFSTFIQDEIRLSNSLSVTVGTKLEHNAYTGFEIEPSFQLVWQPRERQAIWISVARAIRQPSREDSGLRLDLFTIPQPGGGFALVKGIGTPNPQAEQLNSLEVGYRAQVAKKLSLDFSTYANFYRHLEIPSPAAPFFTADPPPPHLVLPLTDSYTSRAQTYGGEVSANWNVTSRWRLSPGFALIRTRIELDPLSMDPTGPEIAANTPEHQIQFRSLLDLTHNMDWDVTYLYVGRLRDGGNGAVPGYHRVDTRLAYRVGEYTEFSVVGQNLLRPSHAEFHRAYEVLNTLVERSVFGKITWRF